jgi:hypothetical protein
MKNRILLFSVIIAVVEYTIISCSVLAQVSTINSGVSWLVANQDASGLWGVAKKTPFRDATVVVDVLSALNADSVVINKGLGAINSIATSSSDYLARKIMATVSASGGSAPSYLIDSLANMQNPDGGWGYQKGYGSNNLETALALRSLKAAQYTNMSKLGQGVGYLTSHQNADSGWSFVAGDSSRVYYTAQAVIALCALKGDFSVSIQIRRGVNWLKTQDHGDGGFGTGDVSNPYETGLALAAMIKGGYSGSEVTNAMNYLETTQLVDGSWNSDAYSTAKAIYGLMHVAPDLAILTSDIVLSNPAPVDSDMVTISATVRNLGVQDAESILVQVFDGHPDLAGIQIGTDVIISTLAPGGDSTIQVEWNTLNLAGDHDIYVFVDPLNEIREPDKLNNVAKKPVHVYFPPDLIIYNIEFDPPEPDTTDTVIIRTVVKNVGEVTATNVSLQVWNGDPDAGGIPLMGSPYIIASIAPNGGQFTLNLDMGNYFNTDGCYPIYACADRENTIREIYEFNNCRCETLCVGPVCLAAPLGTGLNLLGLPLQPIDPFTSYTMIPQIPNCNEIDGWDRVLQGWISAVDIGGGVIIGDEFPIELRDGFFARVTAPGDTDFCGMRVKEHGCTHFEPGLNMTSVPNEDACYTAYTLIDDINTCDEAHMWDVVLQGWESAAEIAESVFIGEDFPVTPGNGYFVKVYSASDWCTKTCDTVTNLPDLLVTPDDILLDPNPVQSGDTVGIFVNINNIGNDTAYSPRLDIYMGDPDAGGTPLAGGNLPVDIPPGGASGYYGNYFVFGGSGFVDIYGIADYYNAILELNETNNQAYKTLQITSIFATSEQRPGYEQSSAKPIASLDEGRGKSLTLNPEVAPVPVQISSLPSVPVEDPITKEAAKTSTSGVVTEIDNVIIGNHSSSSATITWITDGLADGCINYGTTPALGLTKCEDEPGSEVHMVVLDNLSENTSYYFEVVSGGITDDNEGDYYSFTTTMLGAGLPAVIYGHVYKAGADSPVGNVIVSGTLRHGESISYPLIALTNSEGIWVLNLGNLKSPASNNVLPYKMGDTIFLQLQGGSNGVGADTIVISGTSPQSCGVQEIGISTQVDETIEPPTELLPDHYYLSPNYPNPFNASTMIKFGLPIAGHVELSIYNILGKKVITLLDQDYQAGNHGVIWNGQNATGQPVSSGIYFFRLKSGEFIQIRKLLLLK